jgi:hypothetical protein
MYFIGQYVYIDSNKDDKRYEGMVLKVLAPLSETSRVIRIEIISSEHFPHRVGEVGTIQLEKIKPYMMSNKEAIKLLRKR